MVRWSAGRRAAAAAVVSVVGGVLLTLPLTSAKAEMVEVDLRYRCNTQSDGVAPNQVNLKVTLGMQAHPAVGQPLDVRWGLAYGDATRFVAPGMAPAGSILSATGVVGVSGDLWDGELNSIGSKDQGALTEGAPLELPGLVSGVVTTTAAGVIQIVPKNLTIDFTPKAGEINDNELPASAYVGAGWGYYHDRKAEFHDLQNDVHATQVKGDSVSFAFTGTGVDFISERDPRAGELEFKIGDADVKPATADASKNADNTPVTVENQGNQTLWSVRGLPYKKHTLTVKNNADAWAMVDGFKVVTEATAQPPFRVVCKPVTKPAAIRVTIGSGPSSTVSASSSTSVSASTSASASASSSASVSPTPTHTTTVTVTASPSPTVTTTVTLTATPTVPQVSVTPKGGAQTGEAPERDLTSAVLLVGSGAAMLAVGVFSGLALLRRRAAHARSTTVRGG
ncbi:hypothetical protein JOL79_13900 [Microbispora sp. RL4-1S]|uniref:Uncharacterized protein n=1 Tax=Microbispora oryzae TaxID=2806554 RepID=A0A941AQM1_9ACTN|nr:hypothetical protein [Microbispora oryzae]MBP2704909.1 hypothetical protein [Microbispora oryzae]